MTHATLYTCIECTWEVVGVLVNVVVGVVVWVVVPVDVGDDVGVVVVRHSHTQGYCSYIDVFCWDARMREYVIYTYSCERTGACRDNVNI